MYVYSRRSYIYHHEDCRHAKRILPQNRCGFADEAQARDADYTVCGCCGDMKKRVRRHMQPLANLCAAYKIRLHFFDQAVYFKTSRSWWKVKPGSGGSLILCHENTRYIYYNRETTPCHRREYHVQDCRCHSIIGYLQYIAAHEKWRNAIEHPRTKKQKRIAKKAEAKRRRTAITRVQLLIDSVSASALPQASCLGNA